MLVVEGVEEMEATAAVPVAVAFVELVVAAAVVDFAAMMVCLWMLDAVDWVVSFLAPVLV